jgi:hypothetical protein
VAAHNRAPENHLEAWGRLNNIVCLLFSLAHRGAKANVASHQWRWRRGVFLEQSAAGL